MSALFPPFVRVALDGGALELGWLMSSQAVGGLIGGVVSSGRWRPGFHLPVCLA